MHDAISHSTRVLFFVTHRKASRELDVYLVFSDQEYYNAAQELCAHSSHDRTKNFTFLGGSNYTPGRGKIVPRNIIQYNIYNV